MAVIRTAVVGLGMGYAHAHAYKTAARSDLRWVCDLDKERAAKVAAEVGCDYTDNWASILDEVDAVSICTPHHLHAPQTLQAIAAGKHVLVEKPMANSEAECQAMIEASEKAGVTLMVAYTVRYRPAVARLRQAVVNEEFGKPFNANCWIEGYLEPRPNSWFARRDQLGGGVLFSHGCHYVDILIWYMGKVERVGYLGTRLGTDWLEGEGTSHSIMQFESGALGYLETSWGMRYNDRKDLLHIHTPQALLTLDKGMRRAEALTAGGRTVLYEPPADARHGPGDSVIGEIEHFLDCIETGQRPETDGYEALKSLRTIWAMYGQDGAPVDWPESPAERGVS